MCCPSGSAPADRRSSAANDAVSGTGWAGNEHVSWQLSENELVIARDELDRLHDDLYVLACAVEDAERDIEALGPSPSARALAETLEWLLSAAKPLRSGVGGRGR